MPSSAFAAQPCSAAPSAAGEWPVYGHDFANSRSQPAETSIDPAAAATLAPAWVFSTNALGDGSQFNNTPVVSGGCVFTASSAGWVYALDVQTGKLVWKHQIPVASAGFGGGIVGSPVVDGSRVILEVNQSPGPFAIALDRSTGDVLWQSAPITTADGYYTNASPVVANGLVAFGISAPEGNSTGQGGFALLAAATGKLVKYTPTIPPLDQAKGYAGGSLWSTPAYDPATRYLYWGSGNPDSKTVEHANTNAILKIDLDRSRATFGQVVGAYKGNVDQYSNDLQTLSHTPACAASDIDGAWPLDDPVCGQLDLDFGASANLFDDGHGNQLVGDLQKSGVYHAARADTMAPAWTALVGLSCAACNAASTAFDGTHIDGVGTPGGELFALNRDTGSAAWLQPIADGAHYQSISTANGVVYTADGNGFLNVLDAATGATITRRPISQDTGEPVGGLTSQGIAIAEHTVLVPVSGLGASSGGGSQPQGGFLVAYRVSS